MRASEKLAEARARSPAAGCKTIAKVARAAAAAASDLQAGRKSGARPSESREHADALRLASEQAEWASERAGGRRLLKVTPLASGTGKKSSRSCCTALERMLSLAVESPANQSHWQISSRCPNPSLGSGQPNQIIISLKRELDLTHIDAGWLKTNQKHPANNKQGRRPPGKHKSRGSGENQLQAATSFAKEHATGPPARRRRFISSPGVARSTERQLFGPSSRGRFGRRATNQFSRRTRTLRWLGPIARPLG